VLLLLTLLSCSDDTVSDVASCDVVLESLEPAAAAPGDSVTLTGAPFTSHFDTALYVGGVRATVAGVTRTDCDTCDTCRAEQACNACEDCDDCDVACRVACVETLDFTVPEAPAGEQHLLLYNAHGSSNTLIFDVTAEPDTGTVPSDSGTVPSDSGTAPSDSGTTGTGSDSGR